jgi:hypothetical protein
MRAARRPEPMNRGAGVEEHRPLTPMAAVWSFRAQTGKSEQNPGISEPRGLLGARSFGVQSKAPYPGGYAWRSWRPYGFPSRTRTVFVNGPIRGLAALDIRPGRPYSDCFTLNCLDRYPAWEENGLGFMRDRRLWRRNVKFPAWPI